MTLAITTALTDYVSAGGVPTPKSTVFPYFSKSHVKVSKIDLSSVETVLTEGIDYTVSPSTGVPSVGTVTFLTAITVGWTIRIKRIIPITQELDLTLGNVDPENLEDALDKLTMLIQQLNDGLASASAFIHGIYSDPTLHAEATGSSNGFMGSDDWNALYNHIANVTNPHATTAAQVGAAPVSHVGSTDLVSGHPAATAVLAGFMAPTDKSKLDSLPVSADPLNVLMDDFLGGALNTSIWLRTTSGTAPTASKLVVEYGAYRELTPAASPSLVLLRSNGSVKASRSLVWEGRVAIGASGGPSNCAVRMGFSSVPATAHGADTDFAYFWWDGVSLWARTRASGTEQATSVTSPDTNYHKYKIDMTVVGSPKFYIDDVLVATHSANPPTSSSLQETFLEISNLTASSHSLDIDYSKTTYARAYV